MTLITVHSPDLVVKGKVGDHSVSELQLNTFVAAKVFSGPRNSRMGGKQSFLLRMDRRISVNDNERQA